MDWQLIGAFDILAILDTLYTILKVAIGLGLVIFVHELGHFLVAKACGVKCEKFYLGFDINGWKLAKFQWGETEYGIGILPLGGYVKMLGQDDNPARAAEERERAKMKEAHPVAVTHPGDLPHEPTADDPAVYDPRSYMAKSVPQRMAIISAGVIMNLIFAVIFAAVAYRFGVKFIPSVIGGTSPAYPAWQAGIQPGDKIVRFGNGPEDEHLRFEYDLKINVLLTGANDSLEMGVRRYGTDHIDTVVVRPTGIDKADKNLVVIGVVPSHGLTLLKEPALETTSAAKAKDGFKEGDIITHIRRVTRNINDNPKMPVGDYVRLQGIQWQFSDIPLEYYVKRRDPKNPDGERIDAVVRVDPNPIRTLGLVMKMGPVSAIQAGSPADRAGFQVGDQIVSINGKTDLDPLRIGELFKMAETNTVEVKRKDATISLKVEPRQPRDFIVGTEDGPASCDELGIAFYVLNIVQSVEPGSPADGKVLPGDEITSASIPPADDDEAAQFKKSELDKAIEFNNKDKRNWPSLHGLLQQLPLGHKLELSWTHESAARKETFQTAAAKKWFSNSRGLSLEALTEIRKVESWGEAFSLGVRETKESVGQVVTTLRKLVGGELSLSGFGGPITIARAAGQTASEGITRLLIFLTLLSANLAVINFLPIPVLDGGHMMFLLYEGIRGKPASEKAMVMLTYLGLIFILALMIFVLGLDITRLFK